MHRFINQYFSTDFVASAICQHMNSSLQGPLEWTWILIRNMMIKEGKNYAQASGGSPPNAVFGVKP